MQGVYEIVNKLNGKAYGGSSGNIEERWADHCRMLHNGKHHCAHLQNAWDKHGEDAFEFRVVEETDGPDGCLAAEQAWLDEYYTLGTCYNTARDATAPMLGCKHTDEAKQKMSEAHTGKKRPPFTQEHRRNISVAKVGNQNAKGSKRTDEDCRKQSERMMGNQNALGHVPTEEHKRKLREASTGRVASAETRRKMSIARIGNKNALGNRSALGYKHTEEFRRRQSKRMTGNQNSLGYKHTEEARRNMSVAHTGELHHMWGKEHTDETKRKQSEARKQWWAKKRASDCACPQA